MDGKIGRRLKRIAIVVFENLLAYSVSKFILLFVTFYILMWIIYEIIHFWTAVVDESEE